MTGIPTRKRLLLSEVTELKKCYACFCNNTIDTEFCEDIYQTFTAKRGNLHIQAGRFLELKETLPSSNATTEMATTTTYGQFISVFSHTYKGKDVVWIYCKIFLNVKKVPIERIHIGNSNLYFETFFPPDIDAKMIHAVQNDNMYYLMIGYS